MGAARECTSDRRDVVVVVEDDADIRSSLELILGMADYAVVTTANGQEALEVLEDLDGSPCLVLLDLMMPVMDGWELRDKLRQDQRFSDIPICVLSGVANIDEEVRQLDVDGYLQKPFGTNEIIDVASRYCCTID